MTIVEIRPELKYPPIFDGNKVSYLLLHLAVPSHSSPHSNMHLSAAKKAASILGIKLSTIIVDIENNKSLTGIKRYLFRFPYFRREDKLASRFADTVLIAASITFGPFLDERDEESSFRIPMSLIRNRKNVFLGELIQIEETRMWEDRITEFPGTLLGSSSEFSESPVERAWKLTPLLFNNDKFLRAFRFLKTSQENFFAGSDQIDDIVRDAHTTAESVFQQSHLENALQDSFKAIEAILGDPPKDDSKFFLKIKSIGLDPHIKFGLDDKPIYQVIRDMNDARDKKAAHGSTQNRAITVGDMLVYQSCARLIVLQASKFEISRMH